MITIYTKDDCQQCKMTEKLKELGFKAAPVIETATDTWVGFQPAKIKAEIKLQSA